MVVSSIIGFGFLLLKETNDLMLHDINYTCVPWTNEIENVFHEKVGTWKVNRYHYARFYTMIVETNSTTKQLVLTRNVGVTKLRRFDNSKLSMWNFCHVINQVLQRIVLLTVSY